MSFSLFLYPQCIAAYRDSYQFWGYMTNFGGKKPSAEGKWECFFNYCKFLIIEPAVKKEP